MPNTLHRTGKQTHMRSWFTALALVLTASIASAQSVDPPTYAVGDSWTIKQGSNTREVKVLKVGEAGSVEMLGFLAQCPACIVQLDRSLTIVALLDGGGKPADPSTVGFVPMGAGWQLFAFPLEPGKRWDFSASAIMRNQYENYEFSNRVDRLEDVKTSAGTFKAYRIVRDIVLKGGQAMGRPRDVKWQTTSWFAPDVKFVVKSTSTSPTGQDSELVSYRVK
ncbi:MAG: hypothetical protein ACREKH_14015 [Candidatus Rokuibacteriota bacterium]